jgi:hypothetical protein
LNIISAKKFIFFLLLKVGARVRVARKRGESLNGLAGKASGEFGPQPTSFWDPTLGAHCSLGCHTLITRKVNKSAFDNKKDGIRLLLMNINQAMLPSGK